MRYDTATTKAGRPMGAWGTDPFPSPRKIASSYKKQEVYAVEINNNDVVKQYKSELGTNKFILKEFKHLYC